ncbi:MAG: hypothetical protein Ct9H300mP12_07180 [Acidimicrobiales bacterium]|nr:MAG: hypothetical protein Ct9H300mP12_07180 [Acidimicrobiales bacterium]
MLLVLLALAQPDRPGRTMKRRPPLGNPKLRVDHGHHHVTSAIPPFVIHALAPFSTHSSLASSYTARAR